MAIGDRDSKLTINTELVGNKKVESGLAGIKTEAQELGAASAGTADALGQTAAELSRIDDASATAADSTRETAAALRASSEAADENARSMAAAGAVATKSADAATTAAHEQEAATRDAGAAARETATDTEQAAKVTESAIERLTATFREESAAAHEVGAAFDAASAVTRVEQYISAVRNSGESLETQRAAILSFGDAVAAEFAEVSAAAEKSGDDIKAQAGVTRAAMELVRTSVAEVDAALAKVGDGAVPQFDAIKRASISFTDAAAIGIRTVNEAYEQYGDTLRITPRTLKAVAESAEAVGLALQQSAERGQAATLEQIALYERLQGEVRELTAISNRLTNAGKDNAVGLQETGNRVAGLANSVQQLTSALGPNAARVGLLVGNVGQLGSAYESLKDQLGAVNLAQLGLSKSGGLAASGVAAIVAAALAAVAAGLKLSSVNKEVGQSFDDATDAIKRQIPTQHEIADEWDGLQHATQEVIASLLQYTATGEDWTLTTENATAKQRHLSEALDLVRIAASGGRADMDAYNVLLRDGLSRTEALTAATEHGEEILKFYNETKRAGAQGAELWARAINESAGSADRFHQRVVVLSRGLDVFAAAAAADRDAALKLRLALDKLDRILPNSDKDTAALQVIGKTIEEAAGKVKNLSAAERERIQIIVDLLKRGEDLTEQDRRLAAGLLAHARAGKEASAVLNALTSLHVNNKRATDGTTKSLQEQIHVLNAVAQGHEYNSKQMKEAISNAQAELDATFNLTAAQRSNFQAIIDGLRAIDSARDKSAALETARTTTLAEAEDQLRTRTLQTSAAIRKRLGDLEDLIPLSGEYGGVIKDLASQLQAVLASSVSVSHADRERLQVIIDLASKGHELTAGQQALAVSLIREAQTGRDATEVLNALARAQSQLDTAQHGTTSGISAQIGVLQILAGNWSQNSAAMRIAVGELQNLLNSTDKLTNAEREHIQAIIDATAKQLESAALVKDSVTQLNDTIRQQVTAYVDVDSASDAALESAGLLATVLHGTKDAYNESTTAIGQQAKAAEKALESTKLLSDAERDRAAAIIQLAHEIDELQVREAKSAEQSSDRIDKLREEIAALQELIDAKTGQDKAADKTITQQLNESASVDFLRMKQKALTEELNGSIQSWVASRDATEHAVESRQRMLAALTEEKTANELLQTSSENVTTATAQLVKVVENGRTVWTNIGTAQKDAAAVASEAAEQFVNVISKRYSDGTIVVREVGKAAGESATAIQGLATVAEDAAPRVAKAFDALVAQSLIDKVAIPLEKINDLLKDLQVNADGVESSWGRMAKRFVETGQLAATAAGQKLGAPK